MAEPIAGTNLKELSERGINFAIFESFYHGWDRASLGRACYPPPSLSEGMKSAFIEGYRARLSPTLKAESKGKGDG